MVINMYNRHFARVPTTRVYEADVSEHRYHLDNRSLLDRHLPTDICKSFSLTLLNGRFLGDSLFYFFYSNGSCTVDFMLISDKLFHNIKQYIILCQLQNYQIIVKLPV